MKRLQIEVSGYPGRWFLIWLEWDAAGFLIGAGSYPLTFQELEDAKRERDAMTPLQAAA